MAIDLATTLELQRDGTTADLLDDQDGLTRWLRGSGGPEEASASQLQKLRGHVLALVAAAVRQRTLPPAAVAAVNRAGSAAPGVAKLEAGELVVRYNASPPDAFLADIATSAITLVGGPGRDRLRPMVRRVPAAAALVLTYLRQPSPSRPVPGASSGPSSAAMTRQPARPAAASPGRFPGRSPGRENRV
jgi:hypothetical protein